MKYLLLACTVALLTTSCNKEQTKDVPLTRTQMLYGSNTTNASNSMPSQWKTAEYKVIFQKADGSDSADVGLYDECRKDDFLQFFENYSGKHTTSDNKCFTNDGDIYNFRWEFNNNGDSISFYNCDRLFKYRTFKVAMADFSASNFTLKFREPWVVNNVLDTVRIEHKFQKN